jgi:hypothetical protein
MREMSPISSCWRVAVAISHQLRILRDRHRARAALRPRQFYTLNEHAFGFCAPRCHAWRQTLEPIEPLRAGGRRIPMFEALIITLREGVEAVRCCDRGHHPDRRGPS